MPKHVFRILCTRCGAEFWVDALSALVGPERVSERVFCEACVELLGRPEGEPGKPEDGAAGVELEELSKDGAVVGGKVRF